MTIDKFTVKDKAEASILQINLGYHIQQDRLLLRVGLADNSELLVWLTCRITKQVWHLLSGETQLPTATSIQVQTPPQQAVDKFKQEVRVTEALQKLDFATEYQARNEVVNNGAMLATSVQVINAENRPPSLEMPCLEGITVRMNLTQELILALCNLLQLSAKEAVWDLGAITQSKMQTQANTAIQIDTQYKKVLH